MNAFNIHEFIASHVTGRATSFFQPDIEHKKILLQNEIENRAVLVIGGGGTIGSNYIKSLLQFKPAKLVVIDNNENALTELVRDIRSTPGLKVPDNFITYPINFSSTIFNKIYQFHKPFDIVANFAAHKHVRSEKDIFSVEAMLENNLLHAHKLMQLLEQENPAHFFCVSTDKAANPVNIMGATKKLMEEMVLSFAASLKCTTARFANVAFSNGSLPDGFLNRIKYNQPLSVPSDVTRYFISPQESGDICMLASILGNSGEIYFPKFEKTQLSGFLNIAIELLQALGFEADMCESETEAREKSLLLAKGSRKYPIYSFISDTTGEKLYEEFYTQEETVDLNTFHSLGIIKNSATHSHQNIDNCMTDLKSLFKKDTIEKTEVVKLLSRYIPTFDHLEKGASLDAKM